MENLSNNFLVPMSNLTGTVFNRSLIYLCNHNKSGALGFIINKPIAKKDLENILTETGLEQIKSKIEIYFGGPVEINSGMILHDNKYHTKNTMNISKLISLSSSRRVINDIISGNGPEEFKFILGYSGWGENQLEEEITNGDWLVVPSDYDLIFKTPHNKILDELISFIDIDLKTVNISPPGLS